MAKSLGQRVVESNRARWGVLLKGFGEEPRPTGGEDPEEFRAFVGATTPGEVVNQAIDYWDLGVLMAALDYGHKQGQISDSEFVAVAGQAQLQESDFST